MQSASDLAVVAGLKTDDRVLLIGGKSHLSAIRKTTKRVDVATRATEVDRLTGEGRRYEKVFLMAGGFPSQLPSAVKLLDTHGVLLFLSDEPGIRDIFLETIEKNFSSTFVFQADSSVGPVIACSPKGPSRWEVR